MSRMGEDSLPSGTKFVTVKLRFAGSVTGMGPSSGITLHIYKIIRETKTRLVAKGKVAFRKSDGFQIGSKSGGRFSLSTYGSPTTQEDKDQVLKTREAYDAASTLHRLKNMITWENVDEVKKVLRLLEDAVAPKG